MDTTLLKLEHRLLAWATLALIIAVALKNWYLYRQVRKLQAGLVVRRRSPDRAA